MWFVAIGTVLILGSVLGLRFGINLYHSGRPGAKGRMDNSLCNRIAIAVVGVILILFGLSKYYPK